MSSGQRTLFGEVASWVVLSAMAVVGVTHFDQLKIIAQQVLGTEIASVGAANGHQDGRSHAADAPTQASSGYTVELPLGPDGHYHADAEINGRPVKVLVDTGASLVALTAEDAEAAGVFVTDKDFTHQIQTANGTARVAPIVLDRVSIGDITVRDVRGVVSEVGAMSVSLLGMTFINELERVDMRSGKLILQD